MSNITKKIKELESIKPSKQWKSQKRELLLSQIKAQKYENFSYSQLQSSRHFLGMFFPQKFMKPTVAFALMISLVLSSGVATVSASQNSLPGDVLYSVKRATERARLSLLLDEGEKATLQMEFVERRVDELGQIITNNNESKKVQMAINGLRDDIKNVKDRLASLQKQSIIRPKEVVGIAKVVDDKTNEYQESLNKVKDILPKEVKKEVEETLDSISETGEKALEVIIDNYDEEEVEMSKEEVIDRVQKKMDIAHQQIEQLEEDIETAENIEVAEEGVDKENETTEEDVAGNNTEAEEGEAENTQTEESTSEEEVLQDEAQQEGDETTESQDEEAEPARNASHCDAGGESVDDAQNEEIIEEELNLEDIKEKPQEASKILDEAKDLLDQGDILSAFEKIQESTKMTKDVKNVVVEVVSNEEAEEESGDVEEIVEEEPTSLNEETNNELNIETETELGIGVGNEESEEVVDEEVQEENTSSEEQTEEEPETDFVSDSGSQEEENI